MVDQIRAYGAMMLVLADKHERWPLLAEGARRFGWFVTSPFAAPVVGSHPVGIEGYKTIAYETFEQLGNEVPDWFVVPTAYGDVLAGIRRGFEDIQRMGLSDRIPRLVATEIFGSLEQTLAGNSDAVVSATATHRTRALSIGSVQGTYQALAAIRATGGAAVSVTEDELTESRRSLASKEGLFCEFASLTSFAAVRKLRAAGTIGAGESVVCLMTSSGLKDVDQVEADPGDVRSLSGGLDEAVRYLEARYGFTSASP